jgi:uncharacterized caspase-like protein
MTCLQSLGFSAAVLGLLATGCSTQASAPTRWPSLNEHQKSSQGAPSNDAALVISVEDYAFVSDVAGATSNARDWYRYFVENRGISASHVFQVRDSSATREQILQALEKAAHSVKEGGKLWVIFIGHGAPVKVGDSDPEGAIVAVDAQQSLASISTRSVRQSEIVSTIEHAGCAHAVVVLDACFSGHDRVNKSLSASGEQPLIGTANVKATLAISWALAAKSDEFAGELPGEGRPAFSYLMLGALRGWGDANRDGKVTLAEAVDYSAETLAVLPQSHAQTPSYFSSDKDLELSEHATEPKPDLAALFLGGGARTSAQKTAGVAAASVGLVGLVAAGGFAAVAKSRYDDAAGRCSSLGCPEDARSQASASRSLGSVATGLVIGGGALLGIGGVLWFTSPSSQERVGVLADPGGIHVTGVFR